MKEKIPEYIYTFEGAAAHVNLPKSTFERFVKTGVAPQPEKLSQKVFRWWSEDLDAWAERRVQRSQNERWDIRDIGFLEMALNERISRIMNFEDHPTKQEAGQSGPNIWETDDLADLKKETSSQAFDVSKEPSSKGFNLTGMTLTPDEFGFFLGTDHWKIDPLIRSGVIPTDESGMIAFNGLDETLKKAVQANLLLNPFREGGSISARCATLRYFPDLSKLFALEAVNHFFQVYTPES